MIALRRSSERGVSKASWLDSKHSFSFADYYDPKFESFGALRVINEDVIAGGGGTIQPGEIQRMSAGSGIVHAEFNASADKPCHLLQIWIMPSKKGIEPSYEQKRIDAKAVRNHFARIAGSDPQGNEVRLVQDAEIWATNLGPDNEAVHTLRPGRRAYLQVARGEIMLGEDKLGAGDGVCITDQDKITIRSRTEAEALLFDLV